MAASPQFIGAHRAYGHMFQRVGTSDQITTGTAVAVWTAGANGGAITALYMAIKTATTMQLAVRHQLAGGSSINLAIVTPNNISGDANSLMTNIIDDAYLPNLPVFGGQKMLALGPGDKIWVEVVDPDVLGGTLITLGEYALVHVQGGDY